jgi:hypothetical protein
MFFDKTATVHYLTRDLETLFNENGWQTKAKYRSYAPLANDPYRKTFAEVTLFQSVGSDKQVRNVGMYFGYGGTVTPLGEEPVISRHSTLGKLGVGNGTAKVFKFPVYPFIPYQTSIYVNGNLIPEASYVLDGEKGQVSFTTAPAVGAQIQATYAVTDNAPGVPPRMYFFTYEDFREEVAILSTNEDESLSTAGTGDNTNKIFSFPINAGDVKTGSMVVYQDSVQTSPSLYTIDYTTKKITFTTAPATGKKVRVTYLKRLEKDAEGKFPDIRVSAFSSTSPKELAGAALSGLNFMFPSIPTAVSFTPDSNFGLAWTRDSEIYYWGNITKDRIVMYFRIDPAPDPERTFFAPLYIGKLTTIGKEPKKNNVLIGGGRMEDEIPYVSNLKLGNKVVDYGVNTGNGNSSVLVQQTVGGSYNQKHYLAFITHDVDIDKTNESRFNPSVYSDLYHISPMYIVHPSDGYVGKLDEVYAVHPKNISQLDELEVNETAKDETIGFGDGQRTVFHLNHTPVDGSLTLKLDCNIQSSSGFTLNKVDKTITFNTAPAQGVEILAAYEYSQVYRYTLADTPCTPFRLANMTPYSPIGLGMLKENKTT